MRTIQVGAVINVIYLYHELYFYFCCRRKFCETRKSRSKCCKCVPLSKKLAHMLLFQLNFTTSFAATKGVSGVSFRISTLWPLRSSPSLFGSLNISLFMKFMFVMSNSAESMFWGRKLTLTQLHIGSIQHVVSFC